MIVAILRYLVELEIIEAHVIEHRDFLKKLADQKLIVAAGPQVPRNGGVIIANIKDRQTFLEIFAQDPYVKHGLAEYQIYQFNPIIQAS